MQDLVETTIIIKSDPQRDTCHKFRHPAIPARRPPRLGAHCLQSQPSFKGFQALESLPHRLIVCFQQVAPFKMKNLEN